VTHRPKALRAEEHEDELRDEGDREHDVIILARPRSRMRGNTRATNPAETDRNPLHDNLPPFAV